MKIPRKMSSLMPSRLTDQDLCVCQCGLGPIFEWIDRLLHFSLQRKGVFAMRPKISPYSKTPNSAVLYKIAKHILSALSNRVAVFWTLLKLLISRIRNRRKWSELKTEETPFYSFYYPALWLLPVCACASILQHALNQATAHMVLTSLQKETRRLLDWLCG